MKKLVLFLFLAGLFASCEDPPDCYIADPYFKTTHMDVTREIPLPDDGVVVLAGHSNAQMVNVYLQPMLDVPTIDAGFPGHGSTEWADNVGGEYQQIDQLLSAKGYSSSDVTGWVWVAMQKRTFNAAEANDPMLAQSYLNDILYILGRLPTRYPNLETVWIASPQMSFTLDLGMDRQREPSPFRQSIVPLAAAIEYEGPLHIVPGPYMWIDQQCAREDGLTATIDEYNEDGIHPDPVLAERYAQYIAEFLNNPIL